MVGVLAGEQSRIRLDHNIKLNAQKTLSSLIARGLYSIFLLALLSLSQNSNF